ncbi:unnamed protein product [Didymodactylos carnosus]|uniref:F-box domain-containing protein n=1 Tax=Didymodactylos carnosus TaxID=1234261 RepID=A0A815RET0_9BILA|nr:unnamed protein product [Didymodactylos carnosus]CAF4341963.1 unnamed protein product [Didymodactylos carnosus]
MSITTFEILPNEILLEIFYYIKRAEIFYLFFHQNTRFNRLLLNYYTNDIDIRYTSYKAFNYFCSNIMPSIAANIISVTLGYEHCSTEQLYLLSNTCLSFRSLKHLNLHCRQEQDLELYLKLVESLYSLTVTISGHISLSDNTTRCIFNNKNFLFKECSIINGVFSLKNKRYLSTCFIQCLTIELEFYGQLLVLFDFIPYIKILSTKLKWFDFDPHSIINYDYKALHMKISQLSSLKLQFNQIIFANAYDLIELLIQHIVSLEYLTLSIGYLSEPSAIDGRRIEINLLSTLLNLIDFNFYFRFSYKNQQIKSIISSFKNDYWLLKRKQKIICYTDVCQNDFYLYSLPFSFCDIDCISNGITNYKTNDDDCKFQFNSIIPIGTPNAFDLYWPVDAKVLSMFKNVKCLKFYLGSCSSINKSSMLRLKNVNTVICKYLTPDQQLFEQHFSYIFPNVRVLKIDDVSIYRIVGKQLAFDHIKNNYFVKQVIELHLNNLEVNDVDDEKNNYLLEFLQYFSNIQILALEFANKIPIKIIQSVLEVLLLSNKRCLLSFIQFYSWNNNFVITKNVAEIFQRLLIEHFGNDNCYIHIERYYLSFWR